MWPSWWTPTGGFSAGRAIEAGRLLEAEGVGHFEEPCPYWRVEETKRVADALSIDVARGEQDLDLAIWQPMIHLLAVEIMQADVMYVGSPSGPPQVNEASA